jgi:hypothetical protein
MNPEPKNSHEPPQNKVGDSFQPANEITNDRQKRVIRKWALIFTIPFQVTFVLFILTAVLSFSSGLGKNVARSSLTSDFISFCFVGLAVYLSALSLIWKRTVDILGVAMYTFIHGSIWHVIYLGSWLLAHTTLARNFSIALISMNFFSFWSYLETLLSAFLVVGVIHWRLTKIDSATAAPNPSAA